MLTVKGERLQMIANANERRDPKGRLLGVRLALIKATDRRRYEQELRRQTAELNDLFLLLCFMEATALPNPATLYLLEVYPYLLEQFHLWHRRMGIPHSPIGSLPCC